MIKKIIYIANINISTERAHGIQIMKTCEAFMNSDVRVELWVSGGGEHVDKIENKFDIKLLPVLDFLPKNWKFNFYLKSFSFFISMFFAFLKVKEDVIIYTRDEIISFLSFLTHRKVFWESHMIPRIGLLIKARLEKLSGIITISNNLKNIIINNYGVPGSKVITAHDAVDLDEFGRIIPKGEARESLGITHDKKVITYTGSIFRRKGIFTLLEAAKSFSNDFVFLIIGGGVNDRLREAEKFILENGLKNVILKGYIAHEEIPKYLSASDILVLPNSALDRRTRDFTSPLKLFEYMASNRPIIASATPTILEVLNDNNAILVEPDNAKDLKNGILKILKNLEWAQGLAQKARKDVENYTWDKRAERILSFIT